MSCETVAGPSGCRPDFDDEVAALALQLEEIDFYAGNSKGKYPATRPPDIEVTISAFQDVLLTRMGFLGDLKLAHSVGRAVNTDGEIIAELSQRESQVQEDWHLASQISDCDEAESPPPYSQEDDEPSSLEECLRLIAEACNRDNAEEVPALEHDSGPSMTYAARQKYALEILSSPDSECCACSDHFRPCQMVRLGCKCLYCTKCLKRVFKRATVDGRAFPPRCCRQNIPLSLIAAELSSEELDDVDRAGIEFSTENRTYCSNSGCGRFILPRNIRAGKADCDRCGAATCVTCRSAFHDDDCAADPELQATLAHATSEGWQRCPACRAVVELDYGCYHMTCNCGADFCYLCGVKWKNCSCQGWNEENLVARAEDVVDREAERPLLPQERQRRVIRMQEELIENHECEHPGKFQRLLHGGRRGFRCEMCYDWHWKYILQCRRCHITVCEDCRRNRV